jgi:hypothetical protein
MSVTPAGREEGEIQAILLDSGLEDDADLRRSLEELRGFGQSGAPQPRADLAALLAEGAAAEQGAAAEDVSTQAMRRASTPDVASLEQHRRNRQRRMGVVVGAAVVGAMGLGAGAVAASSEDFRNSVGHAVVRIFQPASDSSSVPAPAPTSPATIPAVPAPPTVSVPKPSATEKAASPSSAATSPAQTGPASTHAASNSSASNGSAAAQGAEKGQAPTPARPSQLPTVPGTGLAPKLPAKPLPSVPALPGGVPTVPAKPAPGAP